MTPLSEAGTSAAPFKRGDIVETIKGAKFWGEVVSVYDLNSSFPGHASEWRADLRAIHPDFFGTIHVYPTAQLQVRPPVDAGERQQFPRTLGRIEQAIDAYVDALVARQHGGLAKSAAFEAICEAMGRQPTAEMDARRSVLEASK